MLRRWPSTETNAASDGSFADGTPNNRIHMTDQIIPINWYAVLTAGSIQTYLDTFQLMSDPQLHPLEQDGTRFGKLICSGFTGYSDYEGVLKETRELVSLLTGTLRIRQEPGAISIINIVGVFEDGREEKFPPYGRPTRVSSGMGYMVRKPGAKPRPTTEQFMVEYVVRSGDQLVKDALRYMSGSPDFFDLFKILEVIRWDLGKGDMEKGYSLLWQRGWVTEDQLRDFSFTANKIHRHWDEKRPRPKMDLQQARIMFSRIIEEWIAERAGLQLPPVNMRPGWRA
jgi:hypothetical protein